MTNKKKLSAKERLARLEAYQAAYRAKPENREKNKRYQKARREAMKAKG